jgi:hypothetical protein
MAADYNSRVRDAVTVIAEQLATWDTPFVERDVFGTVDPERIAAAIDAFARAHLGASVAGYLFQIASVSSVHGVVLDNGREVVIKAKPAAETNRDLPFDCASLEAIVAAQRRLADTGFPCPRPLVGPEPLGLGLATAETYLARGERRDPRDPATRALLARGLFEHMQMLDPELAPALRRAPTERLFPQPHSKLFEPSEPDTVWVRELAQRARDIAEAEPGRLRLGHCDWRIEHVQLRGDQIVATYDWDSLAVLPETRIVGVDAHGHTADWSQEAVRNTPTYDDIIAFHADYEAARGQPFTAGERRATRAWTAYHIAYAAWIGIRPGERAWADDTYAGLLAGFGEALLRQ